MQDIYKPAKNEISLGIGVIKQIIKNRSHPLDIIREALSNSCSREINASYFKISIFYDANYGWSMIFEDDGIGMEYTGSKEPEKQGRLDRFLNLAYTGVTGHEADEFGLQGLGSKMMYLCRKLDIETKTKGGPSFKVVVNEPYDKLIKNKTPVSPKPVLFKNIPVSFNNGTVIRVYGYDGGKKYQEYEDPERLKNYLFFRTLIGYTNPKRLIDGFPRITINTPSIHEEEITVGFPWIKKDGAHTEEQKIGTIADPIVVTRRNKKGDEVTITLKGGYALDPAEYNMYDEGILQSKGVGLVYSSRGIPYFNLDFNLYKPQGFGLIYKSCRFVVECDDVETDIAISCIVPDKVKEPLFTAALKEGFKKIIETDDYKEWVKYHREKEKKVLSGTLNQRREKLLRKDQLWVYYKDNLLYKEPENENDVHVLLWKLEGMDAIPFHYFITLEYSAQSEIDIIAEYQEKDLLERKKFTAVDVEYILEDYISHSRTPEQASLIIAWDAKNKNELTRTSESWRYIWEYLGIKLEVMLLKYIPFLEVKSR